MGDELPEDLVAELEAMSDALASRPGHADLAHRFEWLLDALILRGQLPASYRRLADKIRGDRSVVRLAVFQDKYALPEHEIDCASRLELCHARCCDLTVSLSAQDLEEGKLPWSVHEPYLLPKDPETKRCVCMDASGSCTAYAYRPGTCRAYDCRRDVRIWADFEARIPASR